MPAGHSPSFAWRRPLSFITILRTSPSVTCSSRILRSQARSCSSPSQAERSPEPRRQGWHREGSYGSSTARNGQESGPCMYAGRCLERTAGEQFTFPFRATSREALGEESKINMCRSIAIRVHSNFRVHYVCTVEVKTGTNVCNFV